LQGPAGTNGLPGAVGAQGPQGNPGVAGPTGNTGATGAQGAQGAVGPQGPIGNTGLTGLTGAQGPAGPQGLVGNTGATGAVGPAGPQGPAGNVGATGAQGPQGNAGAMGAQGPQGPVGPAGPIDQVSGRNYLFTYSPTSNGVWLNAGSVTVTTHGNNVLATVSGSANIYASWIGYRIMRDGAVHITGGFADAYWIGIGTYDWSFSFSGLDVGLSAGSHTYTLQIAVSDGTTSTWLNEAYLQVVEIND